LPGRNWYLGLPPTDNGFALTDLAGTDRASVNFTTLDMTPPDATKKRTPVLEANETVFNGDFTFYEADDFTFDLPGYSDEDDPAIVDTQDSMYGRAGQLSFPDLSFKHRPTYIPPTATYFEFDVNVKLAGDGDYLRLTVDGLGSPLLDVPVSSLGTGWGTKYAPIPESLRGTSAAFEVKVYDPGILIVGSTIWVDNISIITGEPTRLPPFSIAFADGMPLTYVTNKMRDIAVTITVPETAQNLPWEVTVGLYNDNLVFDAPIDVTSIAGSDYVAASGILTIPSQQTTGTITVPIKGDTTWEPNETFYVNLSSSVGAMIADKQGLGTIVNDDPIAVQAVPYSQPFSAGLPDGNLGWEYYSTGEGRIAVSNGQLRMDDKTNNSVYSLNEAIFHVNLANRTGVQLKLDQVSSGDEINTYVGSQFTGHVNADLIALSVDGAHWVKVTNLAGNFTQRRFALDSLLATAATSAGTSDRSRVRIKLQQYDNQPWSLRQHPGHFHPAGCTDRGGNGGGYCHVIPRQDS
jgi:hypothetical protein